MTSTMAKTALISRVQGAVAWLRGSDAAVGEALTPGTGSHYAAVPDRPRTVAVPLTRPVACLNQPGEWFLPCTSGRW